MNNEEQLPDEEQESAAQAPLNDGNSDSCLGQAMPTAKNPNGHWECESSGWVWYDDIG